MIDPKKLTVLFLCLILGGGALFSLLVKAAVPYTVKKGDTLSAIALCHCTTIEELTCLNQIVDADLIYVGQRINLPEDINTYKVESGDTLSGIADRFNLKLTELIDVNKIIDAEKILIGQRLVLPKSSTNLSNIVQANSNFLWPAEGSIDKEDSPEDILPKGLTIRNDIGTPIRASQAGQVVFSGPAGHYGLLVILRHGNGYETYYAHNLRNLVKEGQNIRQGQIIAYMGNSGELASPQLHFEIREKNKQLDPSQILPLVNYFTGR